MSEFHFASARISTAQLCRASGLERSVPSVLDSLTDILIQYMELLGTTAQEAAESRGSVDVDADDVMLAAVQCNALHGGLHSTDLKNGKPSPATGIEDIIELSNWLRSPAHLRMNSVARPQRQITSVIASAQGAALAALPSSTASKFNTGPHVDPRQDQTTTTDIPANSSIPLAPPPSSDVSSINGSKANGAVVPASEKQQDWLLMALNRQILMGHRDWFVNTELGPHTEPDPKTYG